MALSRRVYPSLVGFYLGVLQTSYFFQLTFMLSSGFTTYLMITLCWLAGSAAGTGYLYRRSIGLKPLLIFGLFAYGLSALLVIVAPFNSSLWFIYAALVFVTGLYPGVFFARMSAVYPASGLFFRENNGFLVGLVAATLLFMVFGRGVLWLILVLNGIVLLILPTPTAGSDELSEQSAV